MPLLPPVPFSQVLPVATIALSMLTFLGVPASVLELPVFLRHCAAQAAAVHQAVTAGLGREHVLLSQSIANACKAVRYNTGDGHWAMNEKAREERKKA